MRNIIFGIVFILMFISFSRVMAQENEIRKPGNFSTLSVDDDLRVELYPSNSDSLEIEIKGGGTEHVVTTTGDGVLSIELSREMPDEARAKVKLWFSDLEKIRVKSDALVVAGDTIRSEHMVFEARTGGKIELKLDLVSLEADVIQGGLLVFYGKVNEQRINASSGGTYSAFDLKSVNTEVKATAGGKAKIHVSGKLKAEANVKGYVGCKGDPEQKIIDTKLGGEIVFF